MLPAAVRNGQKIGWVLALLLLGPAGLAQGLEGVWYGLAPTSLIEMAIACDTVTLKLVAVKQADVSLTARYARGSKFALAQTANLGDQQLLISPQGPADSTVYSALVLFDFVPNQRFQLAWNALDTTARNPLALLRLHQRNPHKLFGQYYYSARFIAALRRLRPLDEMTKPEFDRFFERYAAKVRQATREFEAHEPDYWYKFASQLDGYTFTLNTQALYEEGFCPLQDTYTVQALYLRFYSAKQIAKKVKAILN